MIVRVHPEILESQKLPPDSIGKEIWRKRYESIVDLEKHLHRNGTRIVKFFLHVSNEEQRRRFLERIDQPDKNWKFSRSDIEERARWDDYMKAYEECIAATSTRRAPWYIVPADDKHSARLIISHVVVETLRALDLKYPRLSKHQLQDLKSFRKALEDPVR